jgi:SAM-dependent methyltransferase
VDDELTFRTDLYRGTARFYDEFRLPYPDALVADLLRRAQVRGDGRLLDLACGTGQVAFASRDRFAEVWAVDQEAEFIEFARAKAAAAGVHNVRWITQRAEDVDSDGRFDLITIGNAFHRLRRRDVAALAFGWLPAGGHLALLWSTPPWDGPAASQRTFADLVARWTRLAGADRVAPDWEQHIAADPHANVLREAGFELAGSYEFPHVHDWTVATLLGFMSSTSVLSRAALGEQRAAFEADVREQLLAVESSGVFRDEVRFGYDLARRP